MRLCLGSVYYIGFGNFWLGLGFGNFRFGNFWLDLGSGNIGFGNFGLELWISFHGAFSVVGYVTRGRIGNHGVPTASVESVVSSAEDGPVLGCDELR